MDFVRAGVGLSSLWADLRNQVFLGSEGFVARMHAAVSPEQLLDEIPRMQRRLPTKSLASYLPRGAWRQFALRYGVGLSERRFFNEGDCR